jgi:hypothetical protein
MILQVLEIFRNFENWTSKKRSKAKANTLRFSAPAPADRPLGTDATLRIQIWRAALVKQRAVFC